MTKPSIHHLEPLETGGVEARKGFVFQDHIAARYCLEMLVNEELAQVWCEAQDDVTLIRKISQQEIVEFVQVKGNDLDQLWSIAKLCERERADKKLKQGSSILEKSFAYDRCAEDRRFRLVTSRCVKKELRVLTFPKERRNRDDLNSTVASIKGKLGEIKSENDNQVDFWVDNMIWEEAGDSTSVQAQNIRSLGKWLEAQDVWLASDQQEELYDQLLSRVKKAAVASPKNHPEKKKIHRNELIAWMEQRARKQQSPKGTLKEKLAAIKAPGDYLSIAISLRGHYRKALLDPDFLKLTSNKDRLIADVTSTLHRLKLEVDAGTTPGGLKFYMACVGGMKKMSDAASNSAVPESFFRELSASVLGLVAVGGA